jgi:uncharacterized protein (TIGR00375 family)
MGASLLRLDCDFHIHSRFSAATSPSMNLETISRMGSLKGLHLVGTGDGLHPLWLKEIASLEEESEGIFRGSGSSFVITAEVEDRNRVHHFFILPGLGAAESLREALGPFSEDLDKDGRPHLRVGGEELVDWIREVDGLMGPSHAFVPWTSVYKEYDSLEECYGKGRKGIAFLELGLSADTEMADRIEELRDLTFLSSSDAHSPWPNKLGREFNRLLLGELSYDGIRKALLRRAGHRVVLNVGFDPRLGKYHATACSRCYRLYRGEEAERLHWRCRECGGRVKKGVKDRIRELASYGPPRHPEHRPSYLRIAPLAEILSTALKVKNVYSEKVQGAWKDLVEHFGSEIAVLVDAPMEEILEKSGVQVASLIRSYREGRFRIIEGGGGKYGKVLFQKAAAKKLNTRGQSVIETFLNEGRP